MKHYIDATGNVYGYAKDGSQDHAIKEGLTPILDHEVAGYVRAKQEAEFEQNDYYRKRLYSYPDLGDFVDAWVKGDEQALDEYKQKCLEVKAKYPKPAGF